MKISLFASAAFLLCPSLATATMVFVPIDITLPTGSTAVQSSGAPGGGVASRGLDGNLGNFTHTNGGDPNPNWTGTFAQDETFNTIIVHNRGGGCCPERLSDITVTALDSAMAQVYSSGISNPGNVLGGPASITYSLPAAITARSINVARNPTSSPAPGVLSIGELQIGNLTDVTLPLGTSLTYAGIAGMSVSQGPTVASPPGGGFADRAIDGNLTAANFTHTSANVNTDHFWQVNFGEEMRLEQVEILNRDNCCGERLRDITVSILDGNGLSVFTTPVLNAGNSLGFSGASQSGLDVDFTALNGGSPVVGQTLVITRTPDAVGPTLDDRSVLSLREVIVTGGSIPEPTTTALFGLAASALLLRRKR